MATIKNSPAVVTPAPARTVDYRDYQTAACAAPESTNLGWRFSNKSRAARAVAADVEAMGAGASAKVKGGVVAVDVPYDQADKAFYEKVDARATDAGVCAEVKPYTPFPTVKEWVSIIKELFVVRPYQP